MRLLNRKCWALTPCLHDSTHASCEPSLGDGGASGGGHTCLMPRERSVSFQISEQDCFYSLPLVWPHSQALLHFPEPTPPCSPLTARTDRVPCACVRPGACARVCDCAHACAQRSVCLCVCACVSELAWILLQFDPTQIFLKEKQRRGGRL